MTRSLLIVAAPVTKASHSTPLCVGGCLTTGSLGEMRGGERSPDGWHLPNPLVSRHSQVQPTAVMSITEGRLGKRRAQSQQAPAHS